MPEDFPYFISFPDIKSIVFNSYSIVAKGANKRTNFSLFSRGHIPDEEYGAWDTGECEDVVLNFIHHGTVN